MNTSNTRNLTRTLKTGTETEIETEIERETSKRKQTFLQSTHAKHYGYSSTAKGHIDTWRKKEFPSLIQPISPTPTWKHTRTPQSPDINSDIDCSARSTHNHNDTVSESEQEVYLDYAGSAIPTKSLLEAMHRQSIEYQILANPHSDGPAASRTESQIDQVKKEVLDFFHAHAGPKFGYQLEKNQHQHTQTGDCHLNDDDNDDDSGDDDDDKEEDYHPGYDVIFTSGTTQALQIVAENFAWDSARNINKDDDDDNDGTGKGNSVLVYSHNSHTSVVGMRESAMNHGATFQCKKLVEIEKARSQDFVSWGRSSLGQPQHELHGDNGISNCHNVNVDKDGFTFVEHGGHDKSEAESGKDPTKHLLVFPLECNFSGTRSNAQHIIRASRKATRKSGKWYSMLDIAKAASTSSINLRKLDPDFACVSFYKIFGAPTGIGALFVKRSSKQLLVPEWKWTNVLERERKQKEKERRRYFGGGSVDIQLPTRDFVRLRTSLDSLVHGTINFRSILSLRLGLQEIDLLGMDSVSVRIWVYTYELWVYNVCIFFS